MATKTLASKRPRVAMIRMPSRGVEGGIRAEASLPAMDAPAVFGHTLPRRAVVRAGHGDAASREHLMMVNGTRPRRRRIISDEEAEREYQATLRHQTRIPGETRQEWLDRLLRVELERRRPEPIST